MDYYARQDALESLRIAEKVQQYYEDRIRLSIKLDGTNAANDKLYIAWADDRVKAGQFAGITVGPRSTGYACPGGLMTDNDVFIIKSDNQGTSWTTPIQVNQDKAPGTVNNKDQFYPWVSVNQKGQVAVLYQDRRYDTTPIPNKLARATVSTTTDLVTWKETLIAQFQSNLDNAFRDGAFIGDYNNDLITNDGTIYSVYTGVTPGKTDSDIFIAVFNITSSPQSQPGRLATDPLFLSSKQPSHYE